MRRTLALSTLLLSVTLMCVFAIHGTIPATAGEATPNVTGKWEGSYQGLGAGVSGPITFQLVQEGTKVSGTQSVVTVIPDFGTQQQQWSVQPNFQNGEMDGSTLHFSVPAGNVEGHVNFTLTVTGDTMTGTACAWRCAKLKMKRAQF
jgi:hypothetical protein